MSPSSLYFLGSTLFETEDTPYRKLEAVYQKECAEFLAEELMPNRNLHRNVNVLLRELEGLVAPAAFKKISKAVTEKAINRVKDKIKASSAEILKQMKKEGPLVREDACLFKAAVGKYVRALKLSTAVQQHLLKVVSKEEQSDFNHIYLEYARRKRVFA